MHQLNQNVSHQYFHELKEYDLVRQFPTNATKNKYLQWNSRRSD